MSTKIHVNGLNRSTTDQTLREVFSVYGFVESAQVTVHSSNGKSKGFGFVEMTNSEDAQKAMTILNGKDVEGRKIRVSQATLKRASQPV